MSRFGDFNLAELQQLYAALHHAEEEKLFGPIENTGNLMPRLKGEVVVELHAAIQKDKA